MQRGWGYTGITEAAIQTAASLWTTDCTHRGHHLVLWHLLQLGPWGSCLGLKVPIGIPGTGRAEGR